MLHKQSQQLWSMAWNCGSPLVQVKQTPLSVVSYFHMQ
jgi:hypothetical protein